MITQYGMSDRFGLMGLETIESKYLEGRATLNCSDETAAQVDNEVKELLARCYERAKELIGANLDVLEKIAAFLEEKETITGKEFMEIFNRVKGNKEENSSESEGDVGE